jgi:flagellar assembly protein FliH
LFKLDKNTASVTPFVPEQIMIPVPEVPEEEQEAENEAESGMSLTVEGILAAARRARRTIVESAKQDAERIITNAHNEAARLVNEALGECDDIREDAHRAGYENGKKAADKQYRAEHEKLTAAYTQFLKESDGQYRKMFDDFEGDIRGLILEAVRKVVAQAGETDNTVFESMIKNALEQFRPTGDMKIRVSADDYDRFFPIGSRVVTLDNGAVITLNAARDIKLPDMSILLEDANIEVDAGLGTQMEYIKIAFEHAGDEDVF